MALVFDGRSWTHTAFQGKPLQTASVMVIAEKCMLSVPRTSILTPLQIDTHHLNFTHFEAHHRHGSKSILTVDNLYLDLNGVFHRSREVVKRVVSCNRWCSSSNQDQPTETKIFTICIKMQAEGTGCAPDS
ncbi:hypothetical protein PROFUN_14615 [Planoprotostelium fungivorum]|uniref:Uncharacterized protein n=1 Tax=Planoprotostelium fungivorum TaxID=1890364 RepID=A0A2P6MZE1_9EUKA|nr:hypothetical protein PROFUN_14615 [Planoprotostelium fungivorum]